MKTFCDYGLRLCNDIEQNWVFVMSVTVMTIQVINDHISFT